MNWFDGGLIKFFQITKFQVFDLTINIFSEIVINSQFFQSQCIKENGAVVLLELSEKPERVCLARKQISQDEA